MHEYAIHEHMSFDWIIAVYFFLGGIAAGSFLFSVVAQVWKKELKPLSPIGAIISPLAITLGLLVLVADLGQPFRFYLVLTSFAFTSSLFWGAWGLTIFFIISGLFYLAVKNDDEEKAKKLGYIGIPFAIFAGSYTAFLLGQAPGRVLWHSALMPVLFLTSGIISGIALIMLVAGLKGLQQESIKLNKILATLVGVELLLIVFEMITLLNGSAEAVEVANHLLRGQFSSVFWIVEIILGALIPIALLLKNKNSVSIQAVSTVLILVGVYAMRFIVVVGGQLPSY